MSKEFEEKVLSILEEKVLPTLEEHSIALKTINEHTKIIEEHSKTLNEHTKILNEHSKDLAEIKKYLFILEDKISNELPALFDGFSMNIEKTSEIEFKQKATDKKVEVNSIKISNLEKVSKMHDKQLKKLASH